MRDVKLNPFGTPRCAEYDDILWHYRHAVKYNTDAQFYFALRIKEHRASCPVCRAHMTEANELAKKAKEPQNDCG